MSLDDPQTLPPSMELPINKAVKRKKKFNQMNLIVLSVLTIAMGAFVVLQANTANNVAMDTRSKAAPRINSNKLPLLNSPTPAPDLWYNTDWKYRKLITVKPEKIAGVLAGFPVAVKGTFGQIHCEHAEDVVFTTRSRTILDHEIESYNHVSHELIAWVNISLNPATDNSFYIYYGNNNPTCRSYAKPANVWTTNDYLMVHHLADTNYLDSTNNNYDGIASGTVDLTDAKIGKGISVNNNSHIYGNFTGGRQIGNNATIGAWVYMPDSPEDHNQTNGAGIWGGFENDHSRRFITNLNGSLITPTPMALQPHIWTQHDSLCCHTYGGEVVNANQWYYLNYILEDIDGVSDKMKIYLNGQLHVEETKTNKHYLDPSFMLWKIGQDYENQFLDGIIDEVEVSTQARSPQWIQTTYYNQSSPTDTTLPGQPENPDDFYIFNNEEARNSCYLPCGGEAENDCGDQSLVCGPEWCDKKPGQGCPDISKCYNPSCPTDSDCVCN